MDLYTLDQWLAWINTLHHVEMDLGLDRVRVVAERLGVLQPRCPVIIVGGTNGKGTTVAALEAIYHAAGYQTGTFTSPILFKHNEQVRINSIEADDDTFCQAFAKVRAALGGVSLTPFEFHTLAALLIFQKEPLDVWILEVGLGGRLDAVNILDADVAIVTSIGLDHTQWLGETREAIGKEKAGIFRQGRPAICGDMQPPETLEDYAKKIGATFYCQSRDFRFETITSRQAWTWSCAGTQYQDLPLPRLYFPNLATALMAIHLLQVRLPVNMEQLKKGLANTSLPARIQIIPGDITHIYDVSHNPDAIALLAKHLKTITTSGRTLAVFSMLGDKDILASIKQIKAVIDVWYIAPLQTKRAASKQQLEKAFMEADISFTMCQDIYTAYQRALTGAKEGDRIVVFGSFHTVADHKHSQVLNPLATNSTL